MSNITPKANRRSPWGGLFGRYEALRRIGWNKARSAIVRQLSATECGAASLATVLQYFGKEVGVDQVRDVCGPSRDGVNAAHILDAARTFGLRGRAVGVEIDQLNLLEPGATILHWRFSHFLVFAGLHRDHVDVADPARGFRKVPIDQFAKDFTGVALVFEPSELFRAERRKGTLYPLIRDLILDSGVLFHIVAMSLILQIFGLAMPVLTGQLVDKVMPHGDVDLLKALLAGLAVLFVFQSLANLLRGHLLLHLRTVLDVKLTLGFLDHLVSLPYSYFQLRRAGDLMTRLNSNTIVREQLTSSTLSVVLDGSLVIVYLCILLVASPLLAGAAAFAATLEIIAYLLRRQRRRELRETELDAEIRSRSYQIELFNSIETLKVTGNEGRAVSHWSNLFVDETNAGLNVNVSKMRTDAVLSVMRSAGPMAIMTTGALQVLHGNMTLGTMLALNSVSLGFLGPIGNLLSTALSLEMVGTYLNRVNDVLEAPPEEDPANVRMAPRLEGQVAVENVSFRYGQHGRPVLSGVSLRIEPGQFVAIVGASGSGKTTLASLLVGLYRPSSGRVLFDGTDLTELNLRSVRRQVGIVNQRLSLFGATIRENISLSDPSMNLEEVTRAAKLAHIHEEIEQMPLKYNTTLMEGGSSVSGGQKQRLALARALASRPSILLLDEATSALDAVTEGKVQASLAAQRCTRIVIAHRLSTVRTADVIVVMAGGCIAESGSHEDLLSRQGAYARLVAAQMGRRGAVDPSRERGAPIRAMLGERKGDAGPMEVSPPERTRPIIPTRQRCAGLASGITQPRSPGLFEAVGAGDRLTTLDAEGEDTVITERLRDGGWGK